MGSSRQIIEVFYNMLAQGNLSKLLPLLDEQVTIHISEYMPFGGDYQGRSGFLALMSKLYKFSDSLQPSMVTYFIPENSSFDNGIITSGKFSGKRSEGEDLIVIPFLHYWLLKNEKVLVFRAFYWEKNWMPAKISTPIKSLGFSSNGIDTSRNEDSLG